MKTLRRLFTRCVIVYGALLTISLFGWAVLPETISLVGLYSTGIHLLLLSALLLLPVAIVLSKPRWAALLLIAPALLFVLNYGQQFIPDRTRQPMGGVVLRVMTYNIQWRRSDYRDTLAVIRAADADVVGLQEVSDEAEQLIGTALAAEYPYAVFEGDAFGYAGAGFLSRYPIVQNEYLPGAFGSQRVVLDVGGYPVVAYNLHMPTPFRGSLLHFSVQDRASQISRLIARVQQEQGRVIVGGDFNMPDLSRDYDALTQPLRDSYAEVGWGMGWTHAGPFLFSRFTQTLRILRLDYLFYRGSGLQALQSEVLAVSGGSDHLPVVTTFEVYEPALSSPP